MSNWAFQPALPASAQLLSGGAPPSPTGYVKFWDGSAWVKKPVKVWTGTEWVIKPAKHWTGTAWTETL